MDTTDYRIHSNTDGIHRRHRPHDADPIPPQTPHITTSSHHRPPIPHTQRSGRFRRPSIKVIFGTGFIIFSLIILSMLFYTHYYLPSNNQQIDNLFDGKPKEEHTAPFWFGNYPYDTPYELRDISLYSRIVAIGDLHGDLSQFIKVLQMTDILNEDGQWIAVDTILVQTGDVVDRGQESIEIYKLLLKLRVTALSHHCLVLQLLGNHELMNMAGDYRYVHSQEMYRYGHDEWDRMWSVEHPIGYFLRRTPMVRVIGTTLFVHAGLRPEILGVFEGGNYTERLNEVVLTGNTERDFDFEHFLNVYYDYLTVVGNNGPVWTREFEPRFYNKKMMKKTASDRLKRELMEAEDRKEAIDNYLCDQLDQTLEIMKVKRMVIGHNVQSSGKVKTQCENRLYSIDVGISCAYKCGLGAIVIDVESDLVSIVSPSTS